MRLEYRAGRLVAIAAGGIDPGLKAQIQSVKEELTEYLEKRCGRCGDLSYLNTYWDGRLCKSCIPKVVAEMDSNNSWPEGPESGKW